MTKPFTPVKKIGNENSGTWMLKLLRDTIDVVALKIQSSITCQRDNF